MVVILSLPRNHLRIIDADAKEHNLFDRISSEKL